jgi:hypothetical protein
MDLAQGAVLAHLLAHPGHREPVLGLVVAGRSVVLFGARGRGYRFSVQAMRKICSTMSATSQSTGLVAGICTAPICAPEVSSGARSCWPRHLGGINQDLSDGRAFVV